MAQRYHLLVEFVGKPFYGWQKQGQEIPTVQGVLEGCFDGLISKNRVFVSSCSRTDSGVHALGMSCHVDLERLDRNLLPSKIPFSSLEIQGAVNRKLARDNHPIRIVSAKPVPKTFHARRSTKSKTYLYKVHSGCLYPPVFDIGREWSLFANLSLEPMQEALKVLEGTHDFSSFRASGCSSLSPIKTISQAKVEEVPYDIDSPLHPDSKRFRFFFTAGSFLYNQVRIMTALAVRVGRGKNTVDDVKMILAGRDRTLVPYLAPAHGLYLYNVSYQ